MHSLILTFALGVAAGKGGGGPAQESHLAAIAAGMKPGSWAELKTVGYTAELLKAQNHHILQYAGAAAWDPASRQVLFVGQGHYSALKFIGYSERTNAWTLRATPAWWTGDPKTGKGPIGHAYYNNTIDAARGFLYLHQSGTRFVHRFDIARDEWITLPEIKDAAVGHGTALAHFPERGGLLRVLGGTVHFFDESKKAWGRLSDKTPMGPYHNVAVYSPAQKLVLFGGGNGSKDLYRMDTKGVVTKLNPAPVEIGINTAVVTTDPVSGDFLILHKDDKFFSFDAIRDTWRELPVEGMPFRMQGSPFDVIATPVSTHGVTFFFTAARKGLKVCIYKHAAGKVEPRKNATLLNLPRDRWVKIHEQKPGETVFRRQPHGGSCFDRKRGRLILFGSDSHGRDFSNSPFFFDTASLNWARAYSDDPRETYQVTAEGLPVAGVEGKHPWAMHTFGSVVYDSQRDEMVVPIFDDHLVPGRFTSVFKELWPKIKRKPTWIYDLRRGEWTTLPGEGVSCFPYCAAYDSDRGIVVAIRPEGVHELAGEPRQWKRVTRHGHFGWHTNCAYDSKNRAVVVFGSNENRNDVAAYYPKTGEYRRMPTPGARPPKDQHNPMEFHPDLGKTVVLVDRVEGERKQTETWVYDLASDTWAQASDATLPFACGMNYNMEFDPDHRVMLLVTGGDGTPTRVWALRLGAGT